MNAWHLGSAPIEHRLFGMDRRLFLPTLAVVGVAVLLGLVISAIDSSIPGAEFEAGAVQQMRDRGAIPAPRR